MTAPATIEHCQKLADIACELDALKNNFSPRVKIPLIKIVAQLHNAARFEAGELAGEIYGAEPGGMEHDKNKN